MGVRPPFAPPPPAFTIDAGPGTDYWRQPPNTDLRNAPTVWTTEHHLPLKALISARVTFRARYASQLDQAGILIHILPPVNLVVPPKFVKAGVQLFDGTQRWSSAACEWYADWVPGPPVEAEGGKGKSKAARHDDDDDDNHGHGHGHDGCPPPTAPAPPPWTTILLERTTSRRGTSLNVYRVETLAEGFPRKERRHTLREITWVYGHTDQDWTVKVGAYAARPMNDARGHLEVEFKDLEVQWAPMFPDPGHHGHHRLGVAEAAAGEEGEGKTGGEEVEGDQEEEEEEEEQLEQTRSSGSGSGGGTGLLGRVFQRKRLSG
jgi:regulation of enolase protein 1 (concanavalin A-like superfamily)